MGYAITSNRIGSSELNENALQGPCVCMVLFFTKGTLFMDLLQQAAKAWKEITEYRYLFTYGYKKQLYPIKIIFFYVASHFNPSQDDFDDFN